MSIAELLCRLKIGIGTRGISPGLISEPPVFQRSTVLGIKTDGVVEVHDRVDVIVFLEVGEAAFRVVVRDGTIVPQTLATGCRGRVRARPEFDRLTAIRNGAIVILFKIANDAAVVK